MNQQETDTRRRLNGIGWEDSKEMAVLHRILSVTLTACMSAVAGCSDSAKPEAPTLFVGHSINEGSAAWAAHEPTQAIDPLSRCQQIIRSAVLEQSLLLAQKCREFVSSGAYTIDIKQSDQPIERVFGFTNWRVSVIVLKYLSVERSRVTKEFDSRFRSSTPGQSWRASGGEIIEIRPIDQLELFTGTPDASDAFLVVVSGGK